jgi:hypothetical protein
MILDSGEQCVLARLVAARHEPARPIETAGGAGGGFSPAGRWSPQIATRAPSAKRALPPGSPPQRPANPHLAHQATTNPSKTPEKGRERHRQKRGASGWISEQGTRGQRRAASARFRGCAPAGPLRLLWRMCCGWARENLCKINTVAVLRIGRGERAIARRDHQRRNGACHSSGIPALRRPAK